MVSATRFGAKPLPFCETCSSKMRLAISRALVFVRSYLATRNTSKPRWISTAHANEISRSDMSYAEASSMPFYLIAHVPPRRRALKGFPFKTSFWEGGRVCGVVGCNKSSGLVRQFRGRVVVGADGYRSIVARKVGSYAIDPAHWLVAIRCYQRNVAELSDRIELHYLSAVTPGYFWIFPADEGLANVGIAMLASVMKRRRVRCSSKRCKPLGMIPILHRASAYAAPR